MLIIGIAGGTGSGKSTVSKSIEKELGKDNVVLLSQDSYYANKPHLSFEERSTQNYDHPDAFENGLLLEHLLQLRNGQPIQVPIYNFAQHLRTQETIHVTPRPVVIVEGLLVLAEPQLRKIFDIKVYVDTDADSRILRRIYRDMNERGRSLDSICNQYLNTVKPMHEAFVEPSKRYADIIIPEGGHNMVALSLLVSKIERYLSE